MSASQPLTIHIDGASRGNPGPAAFAYVIARPGVPAIEGSDCLGHLTNNQAEYHALVRVLRRSTELGLQHHLVIHSDSELLVKQMRGQYRVKDSALRALWEEASKLAASFAMVTFEHIPRAQNRRADQLCNEALDGNKKVARDPSRSLEHSTSRMSRGLEEAVREEAVACLRSVAGEWARAGSEDPPAEAVWEQIWSILEEHNVLRRPRDH